MSQPVVFVSYSNQDEREKNQLLAHLTVLQEAAGLVKLWSDDRIGAGADWQVEISQAITQAKVAVLLITVNFLNSGFVLTKIIPSLLQREGLIIFPVIAKACAWYLVDWLAKMQIRPQNGQPVWGDGGSHIDEDLTAIVSEIAALIKNTPQISPVSSFAPTGVQRISPEPPFLALSIDRQKAQFYLNIPFSWLTGDYLQSLVEKITAKLKAVSGAVELYRIRQGSTILDLGIPRETIPYLRLLLRTNDEQFHELQVERVVVEMEPGVYEQWVVKEGQFEVVSSPYSIITNTNGKPEKSETIWPELIPTLDFSTDPEIVRVIAEGERLRYGHLFNPAFATEISLIEPLPHQRIAVYERMLPQTRLRFLLADDPGAGKTIMTGLYIREMLTRRLIRRVLIIPPAGLVDNWESELHQLFKLPFRAIRGGDTRAGNPFIGPDSNLLIISIDTLAGERMFSFLQESEVLPYDLVVFDEAHKLSADQEPDYRVRKTNRYRLAEALVGIVEDQPVDNERWQLDWVCQHLLLLTATPHMGKDFPYYALWRLLQPEVLSTYDAFNAYPFSARQHYFIRRTKEEMVRLDGTPIYPERKSDTLSYELTQGQSSEQSLYEETTDYIQTFYNRATILNRSTARFAMTIFQRRLASSTYALICSLNRRLGKLERLIEDIKAGRIKLEDLYITQRRVEVRDIFDETTGDEESPDLERGLEENEVVEDKALTGVVVESLVQLEAEHSQVQRLLNLAQQVDEDPRGSSKFAKLQEILFDPRYRNEKIIIFTEHRDTLEFLVRRLEGIGFTDQVAHIHGGMDYLERRKQVEKFRRAVVEGGALYLVATDAAGEGINLQFCWIMINYDIPWNPARLEQRMGRIHRYGQEHDPVIIINLVAGKTREGRVLKTLLDKLEAIREQLGSGKVFDVVGRIFEGMSIRDYMTQALTEAGAQAAQRDLEGRLSKNKVEAIEAQEHQIYGANGDVQAELPRLKIDIEQETYRKLLPGYVRNFVERAAPLVHLSLAGSDFEGLFSLHALKPGALDPLWTALEGYAPAQRNHLTFHHSKADDKAIFVHPGEPFFDQFSNYIRARFAHSALYGGVFVDPTTERPYLFHLALLTIERRADPTLRPFIWQEMLEYQLIGLRQFDQELIESCGVEQLLLLRGGQAIPAAVLPLATSASAARDLAHAYITDQIAWPIVQERRQALLETLAERETFLRRGYEYQEIELAKARTSLKDKANEGNVSAKGRLTQIKKRQQSLATQREATLAALHREPQLIVPGEITFLVHALVVPSNDPEERRRHDQAIEMVAMKVVRAYEEAQGAVVKDVSHPDLSRAADLGDHPGFDLLSIRPDGQELAIEVKGRAKIGDIQLSENEWIKASQLQDKYWLYVVYDCATPRPSEPLRVRNPVKMTFRARGGVIIDETEIFTAAEIEE